MTIEYKDSKRITGLSTDVVDTVTFEDDFSGSDSWTDRGTTVAVSTSNDRIDWDVGNGAGTNHDGTWYDLGAGVVNTTKWLLTAKIHVADWTASSASSCHIGVGLTDTKDVAYTTSQDSISLAIGVGTNDNRIYGHHSDSQEALDAQRDQFTITPSSTFASATSVWLKLVRNGSNTMIASLYSNEAMTTLLEEKTTTMAGTPANLRYIMVNGRQQNVNAMDGYVDDIKFYNGVSSLSSKPTNVQDNSILVEKDTAKRYWRTPYSSGTATASDDLTSDNGWTSTGTGNGYNASDYVDFRMITPDSSAKAGGQVLIDLQDADYLNGSNLSNSAFTARIKVNYSTLDLASSNQNRSYLGFFNNNLWGGSNNDGFALHLLLDSSAPRKFYVEIFNDEVFEGSSHRTEFTSTTPTVDTDYYIEFTKNSNVHTIRITTNSDYTGGETQSITYGGVENLRYFGCKARGDTQNNGGIAQGKIEPHIEIFNGVTTADSTPATWTRGAMGVRGVFGGGYNTSAVATNRIDYITIPTAGNATDFGDLTASRYGLSACSNKTRGIWAGGSTGSNSTIIDYVTIATLGDATTFGNISNDTSKTYGVMCLSSETRGIIAGGESGYSNRIDYVTIDTEGNSTTFGATLTSAGKQGSTTSDGTRGVFIGGEGRTPTMDYITIDTTGTCTDFGDLRVSLSNGSQGLVTDGTIGVFSTGSSYSNNIDKITIQTTANSTNFGTMITGRSGVATSSTETRAIFAGGKIGAGSGNYTNIIEFIEIATPATCTDFGDLTEARQVAGGLSNTGADRT